MEQKTDNEHQSENQVNTGAEEETENYQTKIDQLAKEYLICSWCQQECLDKIAREQNKDGVLFDDLTLEERFNVLDKSASRNEKRHNPEGRVDLSHGICQEHFKLVQKQNQKDLADMGL